MKVLTILKPGVMISVLLAQSVVAQELRLFEEPEADPAEQVMPTGPEQVFNQGNGQPAYTLRSISRFGDQYQAVLINRSGEVTKVNWNAGETATIANSGFSVVAAGPATLSLQHPPGDACINSAPVGVSCSSGNQSELRLTVAVPLASNGAPPPMGPQAPEGFFGNGPVPMGPNGFPVDAAQNGQQVFINPFSGEPEVMPQMSEEEALQRAQRQELRAERLRQFEQPRIEDADIPEGMQRMRTPFGDRLMPIRD
jgi:hypothetical protein